jgi:hypothetical protein
VKKFSAIHPSFLEVIAVRFVSENMHEELARWLEKIVDFLKERRVVLHVLEHFHGHDQIIVPNHV